MGEMLFKNWRRKAAIYETSGSEKDEVLSKTSQSSTAKDEMEKIKNKLKRLKASNTIIKFFKSSTHGNGKNFAANADDILNIRRTKETQSFRKPSLTTDKEQKLLSIPGIEMPLSSAQEPVPLTGNQTIFEEEEDIKIVTLPPTPYKNHKKEVPIDCGIST